MKNEQEMPLIEIPRRVVDDDMLYFCHQDDVDDDDSCESLFEGFDRNVTNNSNHVSDSGLDQSVVSTHSERSEDASGNECRKVEQNMDRLKLKLERKMSGLTLNLNGLGVESGLEDSFTETADDAIVSETGVKAIESDGRVGSEKDDLGGRVPIKVGDKGSIAKKTAERSGEAKIVSFADQNLDTSEGNTNALNVSLSNDNGEKDEAAKEFNLSENHKAKKRRASETVEQLIAN